jgi:tryptophan-rich sensory protein
MKNFNIQKYLIRVVKYMIYMVVVFTLIVAIFSLTSDQTMRYENIFRPDTANQLIIFFVAISLVYPLFGFVSKKVYLNKSFSEDKELITEVFINSKYIVVAETETTITFRHSSTFMRAMRMFEDAIIIDFSDNPIVLEGQRRDLYRLARAIEYAIRDDKNDN